MKKFVSGLIIGVMLSITIVSATVSLTATPVTYPVYVNGVLYNNTKPAVNIDDTAYMPVKALGDALGIKVLWNDAKKCLEVGEVQQAQKPVIEFSNIIIKLDKFSTNLEGEAKNNDTVKHTVFVKVAFYDGVGKLLGSASGMILNLMPGETKVFDAMDTEIFKDYKSYKIQIDNLL